MKYKLFVVGEGHGWSENEVLMQIAASNEFNDFKTLIEQLDLFRTEWEVTEHDVTVLGSCHPAK
jgi:hypothetical protein